MAPGLCLKGLKTCWHGAPSFLFCGKLWAPRKGDSDLIDQVTVGSFPAQQGVCKERLFQIISVTTQVAVSCRVHRYKLALRDGQVTEGIQKRGRTRSSAANDLGVER